MEAGDSSEGDGRAARKGGVCPPAQPLPCQGLSDATSLYCSPTSTLAGLRKPYLLVGLFTLEIIHFHLRFLTK